MISVRPGMTLFCILFCILWMQRSAYVHAQSDVQPGSQPGLQSNAQSGSQQGLPQGLQPPRVKHRVDAVYPESARKKQRHGVVILRVLVETSGQVKRFEVLHSAGEDLDAAAIAAILRWRFYPARHHGKEVAAWIRVPFKFALPREVPAHRRPVLQQQKQVETKPGLVKPRPQEEKKKAGEEEAIEVAVRGQKRVRSRAISDFVISNDVLTLAPRQSAADLLTRAPGLYVAQQAGEAVAHRLFLRGFDAEHGQDIELYVGPVPVNQPSHIHGQGYADLNFVIPEVVLSLRVMEGVYDPRQGDFAVAGSAHFELGMQERGYFASTTFGSFGRVRVFLGWAPKGEDERTFAAAVFSRTDGFGQNRGAISGGGMGQYVFAIGSWRAMFHAAAFGNRGNIAGVLRKDDIDSGRVDFYGSYPEPTANAMSALSARTQLALTLERPFDNGARAGMVLWVALTTFRLRINFTGYMERSRVEPSWVGRGDLNEQENQQLSIGTRFYHRTPRFAPWKWFAGNVELGLDFRTDLTGQAQRLLRVPKNDVWDERVDASIWGADVGVYADLDLRLGSHVRLRGGLRADLLYYDVNDKLGNFIPPYQVASHLVGYRRTALGVAVGPRATLEYKPWRWLELSVAYGEGYRSPQARQLTEGENAPFTKVYGADLGATLRFWKERLVFRTAAYLTFLSSDLAFDPSTARLEKTGRSSRKGFVAHLLAKPWPWLTGTLSVTFVHATLDEPPPATPENPNPSFVPGQLLPQVPPLVIRADLGAEHGLVRFWQGTLVGRIGIGLSYLSPRPLPFSEFADPVFLLDASVSLSWRFLKIGLEILNLTGQQYAATEFSYASAWDQRSIPSLVPARHISAGAPRSFLITVSGHF